MAESLVEREMILAWKDKTIYQKAKGCFFIQGCKMKDGTYNVMIDSLWKDKWQFPYIGTIDVGNPKLMLGLTEEEFNKTFE
jgi:hypothetical protein